MVEESAIFHLKQQSVMQKLTNLSKSLFILPVFFVLAMVVGDRKAYFTKNNPDAVKVVKSIKKTKTYVELTE